MKAAELRLMHLSWTSSVLAVKVMLAVVWISLWLWVGVGDVWDVGVVGLLQVLVARLTIL